MTVTAVVDCCHSGTIFDLPFEYDAVTKKNSDYSKVRFPHMKVVDEFRNKMRALKAEQPNTKELAETKSKPSEERGRASKQTTKIQKRKSRSLEPALSLARRSKSPKQDEKHKAPSPTKKREIEKESLKNSVVTAAAPTSTKPSPRVAAKSPKTSKTKPGRAKSPKRGASPKRNTEWKSPFEM